MTPPRKDSPAAPSLGSLGESPRVLLSPLLSMPVPKKTSPGKRTKSPMKFNPSAAASKPPEETMDVSREKPAPATRRASPEPVPGPSWPDISIPLPAKPLEEDLPPRPITLQDVRDYLAAAGEDDRALIHAELSPDTREASHQTSLTPARRSFLTQTTLPAFVMSQNPDGTVTLEHSSIHIRILDTLTHRD